ncbi:transcriptional regulator [Cryobacterium sp. Hh7]|uniref:type IV toxin-antitoxin system AbiEi family antitoxin domain-containing protein n=1 Tax=Cryobacterium sp. Hh7 TaxID=1259159 RepID=UPI0011054C52|nr:type IV toxin-antitoxin system AbiEi family antitoxin domain-containing protein [Cryobacterium sp. Hh7]TFD50712.1 transcriptional regulator [Cryobacterium sp. Hh7]
MSMVVEPILEDLASGQWGLFTAAQARIRLVSRANLSHREREGRLVRLAHGVYRLGGVPVAPLDELRAAWMSTVPEKLAWERVDAPEVVVGGAAAALVHGCGDIAPAPYRLISRDRRQTQRPDIGYWQRVLDPEDVVVVGGLPVTSIERTVADLVDDVGDLSLVGDVLADATRGDRVVDLQRLAGLLAPYAARYGHARGDGSALVEQLRRSAGIDDVAVARALVQRPAVGAALANVISQEVAGQLRVIAEQAQFQLGGYAQLGDQMRLMLAPIQEQSHLISEMADAVLEPVLRQYREQMNQIATTIASQLPTITVQRPTMPVMNFPADTWKLSFASPAVPAATQPRGLGREIPDMDTMSDHERSSEAGEADE